MIISISQKLVELPEFSKIINFNQWFLSLLGSSTPKRNEILTILKMKNLLQDEMKKRKIIEKQHQRTLEKLSHLNVNTEDSIR